MLKSERREKKQRNNRKMRMSGKGTRLILQILGERARGERK